jgi:O-antigen ligase
VVLRSKSKFTVWHYAALAILLAGLLSSLSRGPWLGFAVFAVVALAARPKSAGKVLAAVGPLIIGAAYLLPSSIVQRFVNLLPFIGSADKGSESYRSELFAHAMIVIERYPLFGSHSFLEEPEMQQMVQGQGIVDIVNSYLQVALDFGLVGLFLFLAFFLSLGAFLFVRTARPASHPSHINIGGLLALLIAMLFTIATTSSIAIIPFIIWTFAGICVAVSRLGNEVSWNGAVEAPVKMRVLKAFD